MEYEPSGNQGKDHRKPLLFGQVRRRVRGNELNGQFRGGAAGTNGIPDEGVLIERVSEGSDPWVTVIGNPDRNRLWKQGDFFTTGDGISISVRQKVDEDNYCVDVTYDSRANQPDVMLMPWISSLGDTWETTDIWVDNTLNGYGNYRYGMWNDLSGNPAPGVLATTRPLARSTGSMLGFGTSAPRPPPTSRSTGRSPTQPEWALPGANGWAGLGSVDKNDFPGLANIAPGTFLDVYVEWTLNFAVSPEDLAAGRFYFHTCVRVKLNHVAGETLFGNQDGDREQENIDYF